MIAVLCCTAGLLFVVVLGVFFDTERERERASKHEQGRGAEGERESQAGSMLGAEHDVGLDPTTVGS